MTVVQGGNHATTEASAPSTSSATPAPLRLLQGGDASAKFFDPTATRCRLIPEWLLRRVEVSVGAKLVYAALLRYRSGTYAAASVAELAYDLGLPTKQTQSLLDELVESKLLWMPACGKTPIPRWAFIHYEWMTDDPMPHSELVAASFKQNGLAREVAAQSRRMSAASRERCRQTRTKLDTLDTLTPPPESA